MHTDKLAGGAILLTLFTAVNCGGPASEQGERSDKKEPQPSEKQSGGSSGSGGGVHFAGASGSGGCEGECGGSLGGMGGGTSELAVECVLDIDCPSAGPCHEQVCSNGTCQIRKLSDGAPCWGLCVESGSCDAGECVGTALTFEGKLVDTVYGFAAGEASTVALGHAHFLSDSHAVFADRLATGTLLSLVEREGKVLSVVDRHLTNALLNFERVSARVWASLPTTHLLPIDPNRFVFGGGGEAGIQIFETAGDAITRLSRTWHSDSPFLSMATTPDLLILGEYGTFRGTMGADGSLSPLEHIDAKAGHRLRFIENEGRMFGIGNSQELHSFSPTAAAPESQTELEGVKGLDFDVHPNWLLVQRSARDGDLGDIELYRRGETTPTHSWKQTIHQAPISAAFVQDSLLIEWLDRNEDDALRSMRWELLSLPNLAPKSELSIPLRGGGEGWGNNPSHLVVRGSHILAEPFGQWLHVTDDGELEEFTGPGQGTLGQVLAVDASDAAVVSFDSTHHVSLASGGLKLESGGRLLSQSSGQAGGHGATSARLPLMDPAEGFEPLQQPLEMSAALEVTFFDLNSGEPHTLDERTFEGEALVVRGRDLLVLSGVVKGAINVERHRSFPSDDGLLSYLDRISVPVDFPSRVGQDFRALDYDQVSGDIVLVGCVDEKARGSWFESSSDVTVTFQFDHCPDSVVLMGNKTLVFLHDNDGSQVVEMRLNQQGDAVEILREAELSLSPRKVLARTQNLDTSSLVLEAIGSNGSGLAILDLATLTLKSFHSLPLAPSSVALVGSSLIASTTKSLHQFEPTCGADGTINEEPWPYPDAGEAPPSQTTDCPALPSCQSWEAPIVPGDANRDGCVDGADLNMVQLCFGLEVDPCTESVLADLDGNGTVDDYATVVVNYGKGCN